MSPVDLRRSLNTLHWSQRGLAEAIECDPRLVRRWVSGDSAIPEEVANWLRNLATFAQRNPPPLKWKRGHRSVNV
ncbi:XRE family transcriptional regulator [Acetobacteraceae bacterium EV16G]|uniref:XRE family transcriptional regulator n=1 Tax=Sorlinia euscelidii TaxID=3081148 RepID=A0ABU7U5K8_9PROT